MAAYIIAEIDVTDPVRFEEYRRLVPPTLPPYEGKFVVRGGACETLEGSWQPQRMVVLEFPSVARAKAWLTSPEYAIAKTLRHSAARSRMIVVEGIA